MFRFIKGKQLSWQISIAKHILSYFLQLDNAMIFMLYKKSWLKWVKSIRVCRVYTWSTFKGSDSPQKSPKLAKTSKRLWKHGLMCYTKIPVFYFQKSRYRYLSPIPVYRYFPVYCRGLVSTRSWRSLLNKLLPPLRFLWMHPAAIIGLCSLSRNQ